MPSSSATRARAGRTLGDVVEEIAPGWSPELGFLDGEPLGVATLFGGGIVEPSAEELREAAEIARKWAPIRAALRAGDLVLVDVDGRDVPRSVWFAAGWVFRRAASGSLCLQAGGIEYYEPRFAGIGRARRGGKPARVRTRGNAPYDDEELVEEARAELEAMAKPSKAGAARAVVDRLIRQKRLIPSALDAWVQRIRKAL